jgi:uncharacterized protein (DUF2336 family)
MSPSSIRRRKHEGSGVDFAKDSGTLLALAARRTPEDRQRLLLAIVDHCNQDHAAATLNTGPTQVLLSTILANLAVDAEREIRFRLADKLAAAEWAPSNVVAILARDEIDIARPVIAASPALSDADLMAILESSSAEHQIEVARRPRISQEVVQAILRLPDWAAQTALAGNLSAQLGVEDLADLVERARFAAALRSPLARHPKLSEALAKRLYGWAGSALRQSLARRFRLDSAALDQTLRDARPDAVGEPLPALEQRLVEKLHGAGQLRPGYLLRALREERLSLFCAALATLGGFEIDHVCRAIDADRPDLLAMALAAVGVDRGAFPAVFDRVRRLNNGRPGGDAEARLAAAEPALRRAVGAV